MSFLASFASIPYFVPWGEALSLVGVLGLFFFVLGSFIRRIARIAGAKPRTLRSVWEYLTLFWAAASAYAVITVTGLASQLGLLTAGGLAGLVVSLALQSTLTNAIAGIFLFRDRAVQVGDRIEFSGVKGRVTRIRLRNTWVETDDGAIVMIGNANLSGGPLVNRSARDRLAYLFEG